MVAATGVFLRLRAEVRLLATDESKRQQKKEQKTKGPAARGNSLMQQGWAKPERRDVTYLTGSNWGGSNLLLINVLRDTCGIFIVFRFV